MHLHTRGRRGKERKEEEKNVGGRGSRRPWGTVPVPAPRAESASPRPCHFRSASADGASAPVTELLRPLKGGSPLNTLLTREGERERELWEALCRHVLPRFCSFQLQGGLYSCRAMEGRVRGGGVPLVSAVMRRAGRRGEGTPMCHYLHIIWEASGTLATAAQRAEGAGGLPLKGNLEKTLGAGGWWWEAPSSTLKAL